MASQRELQKYSELLELRTLIEAPSPQEAVLDLHHQREGRTYLVLFVFLFVLPTLAALAIFGFILADRFEAEARLVIRGSSPSIGNAITSVLQSAGVSGATNDAYAVREFMLSRDAMRELQEKYELREAYGRPQADFIWRFPNFYMPRGEEGLYREYRRMISVNYDSTSGVIILRVQGFEAADVNRLAEGLIRSAEQFVNRLNERSQRDAVNSALNEVDEMEHRVIAAQAQLTAYRNRERMVDPGQDSFVIIEGVAKLSLEAAETSMQLRQIERASPDSPQIATIRRRLAAIEAQIVRERGRLAGDSNSLSSKIAEYERLVLEREFSERALMAARSAVEVARAEALRQQIYLERVAAPSTPDYPTYPYRTLLILLVAALSYCLYKVVAAFALDARRHGQT
ncbi:hypothetical protein [Enhydrobacter aerosaccus]|nr:hypothetical protein [Enhydrobacter aerosaccus]